MNKSLIFSGAIILLLVAVGGYFFLSGNGFGDLTFRKNKLEGDLALAGNNLNKEKEKLGYMMGGLKSSFPLGSTIQDQIQEASDLVKKTNYLFNSANTLDPQLKVINPITSIFINDERKNVNLIIAEWQKITDILSIDNIDTTDSEKIKKDIEIIKNYIRDLSNIVESLTPSNSGLSQFQIDTYIAQLPTLEEVEEVIVSIDGAIQTSNNSSAGSSNSSSSTSSTGTNIESPAPITTNPEANLPSVLPEEFVAQQQVVIQAQNQVSAIEEELVEIEEALQEVYPTPETPIVPEVVAPVEINNAYATPPPRGPIVPQGIIIQPGPPRLIQGSDPY